MTFREDPVPETSAARRILPILFLVFMGTVLPVGGYVVTDGLTRAAQQNRFERDANHIFDRIETRIQTTVATLHSVGGLFAASNEVERPEFAAFVRSLGKLPAVQALEWVPRAPLAERPIYENAARRDGYPGFSFTERQPDGTMAPAGARPVYFPVYYVEPHAGNESALGFDLASNAFRLEALQRARDSGELVATGRITLVQETGEQYGFLVFRPVYRAGADITTMAARRENLLGFGLGVFRVGDLVEASIASEPGSTSAMAIEILDKSAPAESRRLYPKSVPPDPQGASGLRATHDLTIAGRHWAIAATSLPGASPFAWQAWAVFLTGLAFTLIAALYLKQAWDRAMKIERLVEKRTAQLRASEDRTHAVIDNVVDAIITIDTKGAIETFNPAAERIFGYSAEECIGHNVSMLMPEPDHGKHDSYLRNYLTTGETKIIGIGREVVGRRKNGESFPMGLSIGEFQLGGKKMFVGICRDISARRQAQRESEDTQAIFRAFADAVPDFISLKDADGRFRFVNKRFEEWVCVKREDVIGKSVHDIYPEAQADEFDALDRKTIDDREIVSREVDLSYPDGYTRSVISTRFPVISASGEMLGLGTVNYDVTTQKRAQEEIVAVNKELESFAYSVSHDLRTPLRGIDGFSQALVEDYGEKLNDEARDYIGRIRAGAQQMGRLIDDLLDLSRVTRSDMTRDAVDLSELANVVVAGLREADPDRHVVFDAQPDLWVRGDKGLLRILLENLIGNAWKFTAQTDGARIELGATLENDELVVAVRDNGAGFDMAYADKLFTPFQRLHSSAEFKGTGIGLATAARIVQRHGGRIWAEGSTGSGATMYFTLGSNLRTLTNE